MKLLLAFFVAILAASVSSASEKSWTQHFTENDTYICAMETPNEYKVAPTYLVYDGDLKLVDGGSSEFVLQFMTSVENEHTFFIQEGTQLIMSKLSIVDDERRPDQVIKVEMWLSNDTSWKQHGTCEIPPAWLLN